MDRRIKEIYDRYRAHHGKPMPDQIINKMEELREKKLSRSDQEKFIDWNKVPDVLKPINRIKGV